MMRRQAYQARPAKRHMSEVQQTLVKWLYTDGRRRQLLGDTAEVAFATLVQAMATDKLSVITGLHQLMRKGLVDVSLPRGAWSRMVKLTAQGEEKAHSLVIADQPKPIEYELDRKYRQRREKRGHRSDSGKSLKRWSRR